MRLPLSRETLRAAQKTSAERSVNGRQCHVNEVVPCGIYRLLLEQVVPSSLNEPADLIAGIDS